MFGRGMYLSVFYCLFYVTDMSMYLLEEIFSEERDADLNEDEDIRTDDTMYEHWRDVFEYGDYKKKIYALSWKVYVKHKVVLIKREFLVSVMHTKGWKIFGLV